MKKTEKKNKNKKSIRDADIHVQATFNNTLFTATDKAGNTFACVSAGAAGYKNARKSTPFAAQAAAEMLVKKLKTFGVTNVAIKMKGIGSGREAILKYMHDFHVTEIEEKTPIPHNGCRLPKRRRT